MTPSASEAARLSVQIAERAEQRFRARRTQRPGFLLGADEAGDLVASRDQVRDEG